MKLKNVKTAKPYDEMFQLLLKGCTIEALSELENRTGARVSVVVERMYD